jgi:hypothetical protein
VLHALCGRCQTTSPKQRGLERADIAARCRDGLFDFRNGDRLDLDQKIRMREAAHLDGGLVGSAPEYSIRTPTCLQNSSMSVVKVWVAKPAPTSPESASPQC